MGRPVVVHVGVANLYLRAQMFQNILNKVGFGGLPSNFGYTVGDKVELPYASLWDLHKGQKRSDGSAVSVFVCPKKDLSPHKISAAKNAEQVAKSLRHPNVLRALDSCDTDGGLYLVTEAVVPLFMDAPSDVEDDGEVAVWGLYQALDALSFLHGSGFTHGLFGPTSVFVTPQGDYRLGGFEQCSKGFDLDSYVSGWRNSSPNLQGWPEPPRDLQSKKGVPSVAVDFWGAAVLIAYLYGSAQKRQHGPDFRPDLENAEQSLPLDIRRQFGELQRIGPLKGRNPIQDFLNDTYFVQHPAIRVMSFLKDLHIKSAEEKEVFFEGLPPLLMELPKRTQTRQVLPELMVAQKFPGLEAAQVLPSILKIGVRLGTEDFKEKVAPLVVQLFASPDRAVRFRLLASLGDMIDYLDEAMINDKIFPECVNGFNDSNAPIREATVKSLIHFTPKLRPKIVEQRIVKLLPKLFQDPEAAIRTNAIICTGRIASHFPKAQANQLLMQGFTQGLKDGFGPCRSASLHTLLATYTFFSTEDLACRLLPLVCQRLVDPDPSVADIAFVVLDDLKQKLRTMVEEQRVEQRRVAEAGGTPSAAGTEDALSGKQGVWGSWASSVGGIAGNTLLGSMGNMSSMMGAMGANMGVIGGSSSSIKVDSTGSLASAFSAGSLGGTPTSAATTSTEARPAVASAPAPARMGGGTFSPAAPVAAPAQAAAVPKAAPTWGNDADFWDEFGDMPAPPKEEAMASSASSVKKGMSLSAGAAAPKSAASAVVPKKAGSAVAPVAKAPAAKASSTAAWSSTAEDDFWSEFDK